ncbi:MAG: PAS domain S-box protein [Euryarchaeota archaeon]|nr:PAS domain S-box protein [Euryarchaeota archaeon]
MGESLPLQELIDFDELQEIQDGFAKVICTSSVIFSPEGDALTRFSNPTGFCSLIQSTKEGMRCCFQSFADMGQKVLESDEPVLMRCFAHGAHFAAPIIIDSERKATMFMGQFVTEEFSSEKLKELREIATQIDVDPDRLVAEAKKMRVVKEDVVRNYTAALSQSVGVIARLGAQAVELVRAKDALQESHDELESRVEERTAELALANIGLKREIAEREIAEDHVERLNSVLKAIRNVNQLIVSEKDRDSLLRKACDILLEARGYDAAWFGLLRDDTTFEMVLGSDSRRDPSQFCDDMVGRGPSQCFKDALTQKEGVTIVDKSVECEECTFRSAYVDNATVIIRIEHAGRLFGLLAIALAADVDVASDDDEKELLQEVASDIAFALHDMEMEEARKAIENALREGEEKYRTLIENIQDGVFLIQDGGLKFVNEAFARIPGYTVEEILGMNFGELVAPEDLDMVADRYTRMIAGEDVPMEYEFRGIRKGEDTRTTVHMTVGFTEYRGKPAVIGTVKDVTERKQMEEALLESEEKYRVLFETAKDAIFLSDETGKFVDVNQAACESLGYSKEELLKLTIGEIDAESTGYEAFQKVRNSIEKESIFRVNQQRKDGTILPVEITGGVLNIGAKRIFLAIARDITERKRLDERMHRVNEELEERVVERTAELKRANEQLNATIEQGYHAQKMESLGILAGGIAHDFNNLLTVTLGNISIAKTIANPNEKLFRMLFDAEKASLRARDLAMQLLAFSKSGEPTKRIIRIAKLIEDSAIFAQRGSNVQCEFEIPDDLMSVDADETQIGQVASNIIINAIQAMPGGGTVKVRCENVKIGAGAGEAGDSIPLAGGDYVRILIKDEGAGIPEEQINRIFDPFFTTKEDGTGLGLATAHSIIEKHGGYLTVKSTVGSGSTFYVYLPAAKEGMLTEATPETSVGGSHGAGDAGAIASGRVLVLDDEEDIRELLGMILVRFGYVVEFSEDGAETIAMYRGAMGSDHAFDVVIVDLTIPGGVGGGDVIRELTQIDPDVRAIVSSGYANDPMMLDYRKYGFSGAIPKPYEVKDLIRTVRELIGAVEGSHESD